MHTATKRWIPQSRAENPEGGFYLQVSPPAPKPKSAEQRIREFEAVTSTRSIRQLLRNFARVANMLALARRRNLCEWTKVFRAGATYNALQELNAAGAISMGTYKILDAWIFWGEKESKAKFKGGWLGKRVQKVQPDTPSSMKRGGLRGGSKSPSAKKLGVKEVKKKGRFKFKKRARHSLASAAAVASAIARVSPSRR